MIIIATSSQCYIGGPSEHLPQKRKKRRLDTLFLALPLICRHHPTLVVCLCNSLLRKYCPSCSNEINKHFLNELTDKECKLPRGFCLSVHCCILAVRRVYIEAEPAIQLRPKNMTLMTECLSSLFPDGQFVLQWDSLPRDPSSRHVHCPETHSSFCAFILMYPPVIPKQCSPPCLCSKNNLSLD